MIDSHCHLDAELFDADRAAVIARAAARGVEALVVPAVDEASWARIAAFDAPRCHAAYGVHPVALPAMDAAEDEAVLARLEAFARRHPTVAIGECGIDTTIDLAKASVERQERVLAGHFEIAKALDLPLILHARGPHSYELLLEFLKRHSLPARGAVVHSYGGGAELLKQFLAFDLHFGFAGPATYLRARKVRASIAAVPDDRLLAETDAPDQCPEPHRPGRSEPAYVADVIAGLAAARLQPVAEVAERTRANARRLFALPID